MTRTSLAIRAERLGKRYQIGTADRSGSFREAIAGGFRRWGRRAAAIVSGQTQRRQAAEDFWALRDVSFDVPHGDVVGIIGRNGAGKSTLLKLLSRITEPSSGTAEIRGRVASLLEVGTGFHGDLTGRENTYLNGAILGMRRAEIDRNFDRIVDFAEVERFIDTPVKRYSSGMYLRLAFAVAAYLEPDILLVDEVLAVGDAAFQRKCLGKMSDVAREGRTVLFVSHNMGAILRLCGRTVWLNGGQIAQDGPTADVIASYVQQGLVGEAERRWTVDDAPGDETIRLVEARICQPAGNPSAALDITQPFSVEIVTEAIQTLPEVVIGIRVGTPDGQVILHTADILSHEPLPRQPGRMKSVCHLPGFALNVGSYTLTVSADVPHSRVCFIAENVLRWSVEPLSQRMARYGDARWGGYLGPGIAEWDSAPLP
jgi:lipopolysaccharide transport system ATP-binding protein